MKRNIYRALLGALCVHLGPAATAALVGTQGYTNDFATRPVAADFSTSTGIPGGSGDITTGASLDASVQAMITSNLTAPVTDSSPANPPGKLGSAQWTAAGSGYLVTRPTGNASALLLATLINNTGTNCNFLHFNYQLTVADSSTEEIPGQRLYYSLSSASNSWTLLPAVSGLNANQSVSADLPLSQTWTNGSPLYLLWADDNAANSTESAYEIDNFFASAFFADIPLSVALTSPASGQHLGAGAQISVSVILTGSPTNVTYFLDGAPAVMRSTPPFTPVILPTPALGSHTIYVTAQDTNNAMITTITNTFVVDISLSGTLSADTTLSAQNSPYLVSGNLTVPSGVALTIEPGTTVQFSANARVVVDGLLHAVGSPDKRIRLTHATAAEWSGFSFSGNHQSNVFAYVDFEYASGSGNGGSAVIYVKDSQVTFERDTFLKMYGHKYMDIWYPQVSIRHSVFGDVGASYMFTVENLAPNGWFIVDGNLFGTNTGDNDIFHLNHISVKNGPKAVLINNVFTGAGDDHIDDNESDSHIEGNLFLNFTTNHPPRSASCAVTTGEGSGVSTNLHTQRLVVVRNVFWGCDYGIINKDGSAVEVYNCVFVHNRGGIILDEPWRTTDSGPGRSCYVEGCIFWNNWPENGIDQGAFAYLTNSAAYRSGGYYRGATQVTVNHSLLPSQYHYLGTGNVDADPKFTWPTNLMNLSPTNPAFTNGFDGFEANDFLLTNRLIPDVHLMPGSPASGTGPNGNDMGIYVSDQATVAGEPPSPTHETNAVLTVSGLDIGSYKYRLVGPGFTNTWSAPIQAWKYVPRIALSGNTATVTCADHGFADGDLIEVKGADSLCPYYNGQFTIRNVAANSFDFSVSPGTNLLTGEPLGIVWPIRNEGITDIWCRKPQPVELSALGEGTYKVEVIRENSMGVWQTTDSPTLSRQWTVMTTPLLIEAMATTAGSIELRFQGVAGQPYRLETTPQLSPADWQPVQSIAPSSTTGPLTVRDTQGRGSSRFYRIVATTQP